MPIAIDLLDFKLEGQVQHSIIMSNRNTSGLAMGIDATHYVLISRSILMKDGPSFIRNGPSLSANIYRSLKVKYLSYGRSSLICHLKACRVHKNTPSRSDAMIAREYIAVDDRSCRLV